MKLFILTIVIEIVAIISLFIKVEDEDKKRLKKGLTIVKGILCVAFLIMSIFFFTALSVGEILLFISLWLLTQEMEDSESMIIVSCVFIIIGCIIFDGKFYYSPDVDTETTVEEMEVPEEVNAILPKFVCLHNSKTEKYKFFWEWNNGIYKVGEISSKNVDVFADFADDVVPKYEKITKIKYKKNYNFWWEKPKTWKTKKESTYKVYVPEYSLKEYHTN